MEKKLNVSLNLKFTIDVQGELPLKPMNYASMYMQIL